MDCNCCNCNCTFQRAFKFSIDRFLTEYRDNYEECLNSEWENAYISAYDTLEAVNLRVVNLNLRRVGYADILFYVDYSDASYKQLLAMESLNSCILSGETEGFSDLCAEFDQTNELKQQALTDAMLRVSEGGNIISSFIGILVTSFQFYLSYVDLRLLGGILILLCAAFIVAFAAVTAKRGLWKAYSVKAYIKSVREEYVYKAPGKTEVIMIVCVWAVFALIVAIVFCFMALREKEKSYPEVVTCAVSETAVLVIDSVITNTPEDADDIQTATECIDSQLEAISELENFEDVDAEYEDEHEEILALLPSLTEALTDIKESLAGGAVPDSETISRYTELETQLLETAAKITVYNALSEAAGMFE